MRTQLGSCLILFVLIGCASSESTESSGEAESASAPAATSPATPSAASVDLASFEGTWTRDDGRRYVLVQDGQRLVGYDVDEDGFGCRLVLEATDGGLRGAATFTRGEDEGCWLRTPWELKVEGEALVGRVTGVDLDAFHAESGRSWEERHLERSAALAEGAREGLLSLAQAHLELDALLAEEDTEGLLAFLRSPELAALEEVEGRETIAARLQALAPRLMTLQASTLEASASKINAQTETPPTTETTDDDDDALTQTDGDPSGSPSGSGAPDIEGFMARFDGSCASVEAALAAYGCAEDDRGEMDWYDLVNPRVVAEGTTDGLPSFTLEADAGITVRTYEVLWSGASIAKVISKGMR